MAVARGARGHAPLGKLLKMDSLRHILASSQTNFRVGDVMLTRLPTNVSCGFTLVLDMSKSFKFQGGALMIQVGANVPPPPK